MHQRIDMMLEWRVSTHTWSVTSFMFFQIMLKQPGILHNATIDT